jgi:hypothetical protein
MWGHRDCTVFRAALEEVRVDFLQPNPGGWGFARLEDINTGGCGPFDERLRAVLVEEGIFDAIPVASEEVCQPYRFGKERGPHDFKEGMHVWTWWRGKHHDAECLDGVSDWVDLPFFRRYVSWGKEPVRRYSAAEERMQYELSARLSMSVMRAILCREGRGR